MENGYDRLKILMLEDSEDDALLIKRVLKKDNLEFISEVVDTESEFRNAIRSFRPDVVLSDHGLPGFNSREALRICHAERAMTPFILVTGTVSDDYAVACLREGADDYILKNNLTRLPSAIRSAVKKRKLEKLKRDTRHTLRKQNDELIKINDELDRLVYSISHNLRGPLASVIGLLHLANLETSVDGIRPLLTMMGVSTSRLDDTINEILEYSKNARSEIQATNIHWPVLVQACLDKLAYLEPQKSTTVRLLTDINFASDEPRITAILTNILSNALQYTHPDRESEITIQITTSHEDCKISVRDNGIGISPEILPRIYEMFFRGHEASKGAGLGLYITREIVRKLNGRIAIHSELNKGTVVSVYLPHNTCNLSQ